MEGYKKRVVAVNMKKSDTVAVLLFFATFVVCGIINLIDKRTPVLSTNSVWFDSLIAFAMFFVGLFLHEGIHALSAIIFGKINGKDIQFGIDWKGGNLYTHFRQPMKVGAYRIALLLPVLITGVVTVIFATAFGGIILVAPGCILIGGATADLYMLFALKNVPKEAYILDHPTAFAYYILYPEGKEPEGFAETGEEEEKEVAEKSMGQPYYSDKDKKKSILMRCLQIILFIAIYMVLMYLISFLMQKL